MLLKISTGKVSTKHSFDDECSYLALISAVAEVTKIPEAELEILVGFPPKLLQPTSIHSLARDLGILSGTTLTARSNAEKKELGKTLLEMGFAPTIIVEALHSMRSKDLEGAIMECDRILSSTSHSSSSVKKMVVWTIPADNSCLFNAIDFLVSEKTPARGPQWYREVVAEVIRSNPEMYNADFLDKSPADYINWILQPCKWGGEIEIAILSEFLQLEIAVVGIQTLVSLVYGQGGGYSKRIYLIYDGSHYDAVVHTDDFRSPSPALHRTTRVLPSGSDDLLDEVKAIAAERQRKRQFTNLQSGAMICKQCDTVLVGQREAVEHAKATGHTNFGEMA